MSRYGNRITQVLKRNGGQASAFNTGFFASSGDIIWFLDSDDLLLPTAAEEATHRLRNSDVVNVNWPLRIITEFGSATGDVSPLKGFPDFDLREITLREGPYFDWNHLSPTTGNAWSRGFLDRVFPMPEIPYRTCADEYLFTLAPIYGRVANGGSVQGCYRAHSSNHGWGRALDDNKVKSDLARLEFSFKVLAQHLAQQGLVAAPQEWRDRNFNYLWMTRLLSARHHIRRLVPPGHSFVLIDGGEWGNEPVAERIAIRLLENNGEFWGPPPDDEQAIREIKRRRNEGCSLIALWWTQYWWIQTYRGLMDHMQSHCLITGYNGLIMFQFMKGTREQL